ncbi:MAG: DUF3316 domain-containing protein [Dysgonamonadaceae bacterium]|jgi:hypothetical protein|nr:DUF3316 domain-containing protein [Dysgonamonadaceae bacterium]
MKLPDNNGCFRMRPYLFTFYILLLSFSLFAQDDRPVRLRYESYSIGLGTDNVYDSYLSPLKYKGLNVGLLCEKMKMLDGKDGNFSFQRQYFVDLSQTQNRTETASNLTLFAEGDYAVFYRFNLNEKFQLFAGPQAGILIGGIYNNRNQNNPMSVKMNLNLGLSGIAAYKLMLKSQPVRFRYQANLPAVGVLFAPQFGQSYYFLSDNENTFFASSFHNHLTFKNILSVELPLNRITIRATYVNSFYQTKINNLLTQCYSNTFYVGISKNFYTVKAGKKDNKNHSTIFK